MDNNATPLERLNDIERSVALLLNEKIGVSTEEVSPQQLTNLPIWKGGEHLLLRCYKRTPIVLSEYRLFVDLQRDDKGKVEVTLSNRKGLLSLIILDCGNAVILLDCDQAKERELKASYFGHLFNLESFNEEEIVPSLIMRLPYLSPIEFGRRWILNSRGALDIGGLIQNREGSIKNRKKGNEAVIQKLALQLRKNSQESSTLKAEVSELKRQVKELMHLIKALNN
tara:strand:+ start:325 stop:1002 length:678 start_codon:yes stop_codon:yes gene_type:complete